MDLEIGEKSLNALKAVHQHNAVKGVLILEFRNAVLII